jgi:Fe-S-cluster-containing dehydrogenase component/DMSO reductase anchor subunit
MSSAIVFPLGNSKRSSPKLAELPAPEILLRELLREQPQLHTAVGSFSRWHEGQVSVAKRYEALIPLSIPSADEQFAFEVNLDRCTGCKSCVVACHGLNGLDDDEAWRDLGLVVAPRESYQQTITTACHHCAEPACLEGCPVLAYDKDVVTGIVRHLDDQCIGCSYCIMKCPYDVPKYNRKRGIVRKCDMCQGRLSAGEAPACVQACPTSAIAIRIVKRGTGFSDLPGAVNSSYTTPSTRYVSARPIPLAAREADAGALRVEETHWPLVWMLIFTQVATGLLVASTAVGSDKLTWIGSGVLMLGMMAAGTHLGQPLKAWRAWMGWRKSWLSREIIAFSLLMGAAAGACLNVLPPVVAAVLGLLSAFTSVMVYVDTKRPAWSMLETIPRFFGTVVISAALGAAWVDPRFLSVASLLGLVKLLWTGRKLLLNRQDASARLMLGPLRWTTVARFSLGLLGVCFGWIHVSVAVSLTFGTEVLERMLYFKTGKAWRMPGL